MPVWEISGCGIVSMREFRMTFGAMINVVTSGFTERFALRWIQEYICAFGGDPSKVTM